MHSEVAHTSSAAEDDLGLARRVARGEHAAFESLMRRYNQRLFRLARASLDNDAEAQDALQEAYFQAYRGMGGFRGEAALSTWLSRLVLNECLARRRRMRRRENVVPMISAQDTMPMVNAVADESAPPEQAVGRLQGLAMLERKLAELPENFRVVFMLRSVEELGVEEVAQVLGIPQDTVRSRHFRARSLLRESLARDFDLAERDLFGFDGARCDAIVATVLARIADAESAESGTSG